MLGMHFRLWRWLNNNNNKESVQEYLTKLDKIVKSKASGNPENKNAAFVFTVKLYIHDTLASNISYFNGSNDDSVNWKSAKGKRLIIIHVITKVGPLCGINPHTS